MPDKKNCPNPKSMPAMHGFLHLLQVSGLPKTGQKVSEIRHNIIYTMHVILLKTYIHSDGYIYYDGQ